ncbi:MAG: peptidoglycan glycosyltransferase [Clostridiaceae bacterium]|nr:peptidoglycan glycosyltransferase [Clostridiaceae bacterium]
MENQNKRITHVMVLICFLFLCIVVYLTYFEVFVKDKILTSSYNRRQWEQEDTTLRGSILDRNGVVLAKSTMDENKQERIYPYGSLYSQVIGYNSKAYGKSLMELYYNNELLNIREYSSIFNFKEKLSGELKTGNNLYLTIDHKLQEKAEQLLRGKNGAVVAMRPKTGEILAMVSKPDFDPSSTKLAQNWEELIKSKDSPFLPRATQGLYVPGSTFKVLTAAAAVENGMEDRTFDDKGSITIDGKIFNNFNSHVYGNLDLKSALAVSSNVAFAQIGSELGEKVLKEIAVRVGMNREIPFDIPLNSSRFPYESMGKTDLAAVGMGQGKLLVTPLHMAMIASGIGNNGIIMKPYLVDRVVSSSDITQKSVKPDKFSQIMSPETAQKVKDMMQYVVETGTGKGAAIKGVKIAGKTGTAENELSSKQKNKEHAWFICFAPVDDPQVAVAVVLEYSGSTGGALAAPIARDLMRQVLGK